MDRRDEHTLEVDKSNNPAHGVCTLPPDEGGTMDVFNSQWKQMTSLTDGAFPSGYVPFEPGAS